MSEWTIHADRQFMTTAIHAFTQFIFIKLKWRKIMSKYIIALDQGTTSSRAIVFDDDLNIVSIAQNEFRQIYPQSGWVEHDPMEIYATQYGVMMEAVAKSGVDAHDIAAIGITNQRETTIMWDKNTGKPVYNAIVWQCRRTADICRSIDDEMTAYIKSATGLLVDAYFSGTKIKWILDNVPGVREKAEKGEVLFGTVDTWLLWKLTGGAVHATDYTNASRTMLFNINTLEWDEKILTYLGIPKACLPNVRFSDSNFGRVNIGGINIPICGIAGDQQAALVGQRCFNVGDAKTTYGTGCFLLMNTGEKPVMSESGLVTTIGIAAKGKVDYALEGSVFVGGAVIQWVRDELGLIRESQDSEYFANKVKDNGGVYIVPAFTGLGAPYWDMEARGAIFGITRGTNRNHIIRAALESIAYQVNDVISAMENDLKADISELKVDGGACANNLLAQFQADITNTKVIRPVVRETTALGAAILAGMSVGLVDKNGHQAVDRVFEPEMAAENREKYLKMWHKAVKRSLDWNE